MATETQEARRETFHEYAAGADCLPWIGWYEDEDGNVTGFVDLAGRVLRRTGETWSDDDRDIAKMSPRNGAWNAVRDAAAAVAGLPKDPDGRTDYWPDSSIACLISLAMKEVGRRLGGANELEERRLRAISRQLEQIFATAECFGLGSG